MVSEIWFKSFDDRHMLISCMLARNIQVSEQKELLFFLLQEKCHQYWPAERSARYQYFVVDPMAEYNMPQYILREFKVTDARVSHICM